MRLLSAVLCQDARIETDGSVIIRNPYPGSIVPASEREGGHTLLMQLQPMKLVMVLAGGSGRVRIDFSLTTPDGESALGEHVNFDWPPGADRHRYLLNIVGGALPVTSGGEYELKLRGNGSPLGVVKLPIYWSDDLDGGNEAASEPR